MKWGHAIQNAAFHLVSLGPSVFGITRHVPPFAWEVGVHEGPQANVGRGIYVGLTSAGQRRPSVG